MRNICCRVFKEQLELIEQLPEEERAIVLYQSIKNAFARFDNQNENQIENQNEYAYVSVSVLSKSIINLLSKNIVCKEFSNNYGGKRIGAGAKKKTIIPQIPLGEPTIVTKSTPTMEEVCTYAAEMNQMAGVGGFKCTKETAEVFWAHYQAINWRIGNESRTPILDWKAKLRQWATRENVRPAPKETERERKERENKQKLEELKKRSRQCQ